MTLLHGWDEIAKYLRVPNRKAQRLEAYGLPVSKTGLMVFSSKELIDLWIARMCSENITIYPKHGRSMRRKPRKRRTTRETLAVILGHEPETDTEVATTCGIQEPDNGDDSDK
jgi:hypothetical protein